MTRPGTVRTAGQSKIIGASLGGSNLRTWYGDASDGDLALSENQTLALDVTSDEGQIFKQYKSLTIPVGAVLRPSHRCNGLIITVQGDLILNGTISVDKCAPLLNANESLHAQSKYISLCGELIGGKGGAGGNGTTASLLPGTGGNGFTFGGGYGGGSAAGSGHGPSSHYYYGYNGGSGEPRPPAGTTMPYPAPTTGNQVVMYGVGGSCAHSGRHCQGGAGPGGSGGAINWEHSDDNPNGIYAVSNGRTGDAYGGGAFYLFVKGNIIIGETGAITADGGNGANGVSAYATNVYASGGGGGGGGGIIAIVYGGTYTNNGSVHANGGHGGARGTYGSYTVNTTNGADGSIGTVFISSFDDLMN